MHKKIYAVCMAACLAFSGLQALAANDPIEKITYPTAEQGEGNIIKSIDGKIPVTVQLADDCTADRRIVYLVLKPEVSAETFLETEDLSAVVAIGQGKTDETLELDWEINLGTAANGNYTLLVGYDLDVQGNYEVSVFRYANPTNIPAETRTLMGKINTAISERNTTALKTLLADETGMQGIGADGTRLAGFNNTQLTQCADAVIAHGVYETDGVLYFDNIDELTVILNQATAYAALSAETDSEKIQQAITDYNDTYYQFDLTTDAYEDKQEDFLEIMQEQTVTDQKSAKSAFNFAALKLQIQSLNYQMVYNTIKEEIDAFPTLTLATLQNKVDNSSTFGKYIKNNIASCKNFANLESKIASYSENSGGGGGGGGGATSPVIGTTTQGLIVSTGTEKEAPAAAARYTDIPTDHWAYNGIECLAQLEVVSGYEDGSFQPNKNVTRAEFVKMLVCAFYPQWLETENECTFADVDAESWYYPYFAAAQQNGLVAGSDGNGEPTRSLTREEMAVIVYNTTKNTLTKENQPVVFTDEAQIGDWAFASVIQLQQAGIISGIDGAFCPKDAVTRAQAATIIYKAIESRTEG